MKKLNARFIHLEKAGVFILGILRDKFCETKTRKRGFAIMCIKRNNFFLVTILLFIVLMLPGIAKAEFPLEVGKNFPKIKLETTDTQHARVLGFLGKKTFGVEDIESEFVLIQIFSMYCPYCQADAPKVNEFFEMLETSPATKGRVKLIGIGAGNSAFEIETFRKKYDIKFSLFPDGDFSIHKKIGEVRTPYFILVKQEKGQAGKILFSKLGSVAKPESFLKVITDLISK